MEYDAAYSYRGIRWLRVKDGMNGAGDREDWVAELPTGTASVHDYQWREPRGGSVKAETFHDAMDIELRRMLEYHLKKAKQLASYALLEQRTVEIIRAYLKK